LRISVLAWGSIIWDPRNLKVLDGFKPTGPRLPLEFCRISGDGRLTLAIDETVGTACTIYSGRSAFKNLDDAIENLRERENMPGPKGVGFTVLRAHKQSQTAIERHPTAVRTITEWLSASGFDAAIWTALATNFVERTKVHFSAAAAIRYLENLNKDSRDRALTYIRNAPPQIETPVRQAVNARWPRSQA
jgi:hypothetical protein